LRHTYLFLTKNPKRYKEFEWPKNAWLGTSVENQAAADERIPLLLQAPAAVRFISAEPLLGPIVLRKKAVNDREIIQATLMGRLDEYSRPVERGIDWVVCGGESGSGARPCHPDWIRSLRDQCQAADVSFFFKQWGEWAEDGPVSGKRYLAKPSGHLIGGDAIRECGDRALYRVGKKKAGRILDGRTWDEMPERM